MGTPYESSQRYTVHIIDRFAVAHEQIVQDQEHLVARRGFKDAGELASAREASIAESKAAER